MFHFGLIWLMSNSTPPQILQKFLKFHVLQLPHVVCHSFSQKIIKSGNFCLFLIDSLNILAMQSGKWLNASKNPVGCWFFFFFSVTSCHLKTCPSKNFKILGHLFIANCWNCHKIRCVSTVSIQIFNFISEISSIVQILHVPRSYDYNTIASNPLHHE